MAKKVRFSDKNQLKEISDGENDYRLENNTSNDDGQENYLDVEGQEDETIRNDGGIEIMPFNLKEELSEGKYDKDGNYVRNKDDLPLDPWLESINWQNINFKSKNDSNKENDDTKDSALNESDKFKLLEELIELLMDGETVIKAIKRYGNSRSKTVQTKAKAKISKKDDSPIKRSNPFDGNDELISKKGKNVDDKSSGSTTNQELTNKMLKVTEIADILINNGEYHIYEYTKESIKHHIKKYKEKDDDDSMLEDAYMLNDRSINDRSTNSSNLSNPKDFETLDIVAKVFWEYKWNSNDESPIYGPFTTEQMVEWINQGFFNDEQTVCRQTDNKDRLFVQLKRIDFDLFI